MEIRARTIGISFIVAMMIGIVVGRVTDNMGLWIAIVSLIGIIVGVVIDMLRTSQKNE